MFFSMFSKQWLTRIRMESNKQPNSNELFLSFEIQWKPTSFNYPNVMPIHAMPTPWLEIKWRIATVEKTLLVLRFNTRQRGSKNHVLFIQLRDNNCVEKKTTRPAHEYYVEYVVGRSARLRYISLENYQSHADYRWYYAFFHVGVPFVFNCSQNLSVRTMISSGCTGVSSIIIRINDVIKGIEFHG